MGRIVSIDQLKSAKISIERKQACELSSHFS